jgi:hypothetical protein
VYAVANNKQGTENAAMQIMMIICSCFLILITAGCATAPRMNQAPASLKELDISSKTDSGVVWKDAEILLIDVPLKKELVKR